MRHGWPIHRSHKTVCFPLQQRNVMIYPRKSAISNTDPVGGMCNGHGARSGMSPVPSHRGAMFPTATIGSGEKYVAAHNNLLVIHDVTPLIFMMEVDYSNCALRYSLGSLSPTEVVMRLFDAEHFGRIWENLNANLLQDVLANVELSKWTEVQAPGSRVVGDFCDDHQRRQHCDECVQAVCPHYSPKASLWQRTGNTSFISLRRTFSDNYFLQGTTNSPVSLQRAACVLFWHGCAVRSLARFASVSNSQTCIRSGVKAVF